MKYADAYDIHKFKCEIGSLNNLFTNIPLTFLGNEGILLIELAL